jgi:hypothetical protein
MIMVLLFFPENIAAATHRADRVGFVLANKRFAEATDVHVNSSLVNVPIATPHAVDKLLPTKYAASVFQHVQYQLELSRAKPQIAIPALHTVGCTV